jgi:hypothetical protein
MLWLSEILTPSTVTVFALIGGFFFFLRGFVFFFTSAIKPETIGFFGLLFKLVKLVFALLSLWLTYMTGFLVLTAIATKMSYFRYLISF